MIYQLGVECSDETIYRVIEGSPLAEITDIIISKHPFNEASKRGEPQSPCDFANAEQRGKYLTFTIQMDTSTLSVAYNDTVYISLKYTCHSKYPFIIEQPDLAAYLSIGLPVYTENNSSYLADAEYKGKCFTTLKDRLLFELVTRLAELDNVSPNNFSIRRDKYYTDFISNPSLFTSYTESFSERADLCKILSMLSSKVTNTTYFS